MTRKKKNQSVGDESNSDMDGLFSGTTLAALSRTTVYRRVPAAVRVRLDHALLARSPGRLRLRRIASEFRLSERYRVSVTALESYARRLEELIRPVLASQVVAGVLGCLPESMRRRMLAGSQVMLLSRAVQALHFEEKTPLPVADLAKLATVIHSIGSRAGSAGHRGTRKKPEENRAEGESSRPGAMGDSDRLAEAVRMIYGLPWPAEEAPDGAASQAVATKDTSAPAAP